MAPDILDDAAQLERLFRDPTFASFQQIAGTAIGHADDRVRAFAVQLLGRWNSSRSDYEDEDEDDDDDDSAADDAAAASAFDIEDIRTPDPDQLEGENAVSAVLGRALEVDEYPLHALLSHCAAEPSPIVRKTALSPLCSVADATEIIPFLQNDPSEDVRAEAARVLGDRGHPSVARVLANALRDESAQTVRYAVLGAIATVFRRAWYVEQQTAQDILLVLNDIIDTKPNSERLIAIEALGAYGHPDACSRLDSLLYNGDKLTRRAAANALMSVEGTHAAAIIVNALQSADEDLRSDVVHAIADHVERVRKQARRTQEGWFRPKKTYYRTEINPEARMIVNALIDLSRESSEQISPDVNRALNETLSALRKKRLEDDFDEEEDNGNTVRTPIQTKETNTEKSIRNSIKNFGPGPTSPVSRFSDISIYTKTSRRRRLLGEEPLVRDFPYELEVAIRTHRTGIAADQEEIWSELRTPDHECRIHAVLIGDDFAIDEPTDVIILPKDGGSTKNAVFRISPKERKGDAWRSHLKIRLYYKLNLLEEIRLSVRIVASDEDRQQYQRNFSIRQTRVIRDISNISDLEARSVNIDVTKAGDVFQISILFRTNDDDEGVTLHAPLNVSPKELEDAMASVRRIWYYYYGTTLDREAEALSTPDQNALFLKLATEGHRIWSRIFRADVHSSFFDLAEYFFAENLPTGSTIQISFARGAEQFVIPWAVLYDKAPAERADLIDAHGFWGMRYVIEHQWEVSRSLPSAADRDAPLALTLLEWSRYESLRTFRTFLDSLENAEVPKIRITRPSIDTAPGALERLSGCADDIVLFFAHGRARTPQRVPISLWERQVLAKDVRDALTSAGLERLVPDIIDSDNRTWIQLTYGRLYAEQLANRIYQLPSQPFVFLNLCESALVTPGDKESFVYLFLNRGASVVLGTESPISPSDGDEFARTILGHLLAGKSIGESLLHSRSEFAAKNDPLGLAYNVYGVASWKIRPHNG